MPSAFSGLESNPSLIGRTLLRSLVDNWWLVLLRGLAGIAFGILAFSWPLATLLSLALLWGVFALADGVFALWAAITGWAADSGQRWWLALAGLAGIVAGGLALLYPGLTAQLFLLFIAAWAIVSGVLQVIGAIALRREISGEWFLVLSGLLSIAIGLVIFAQPLASALAIIWMLGGFAVLIGCCYIALAFRLKSLQRTA